MAQVYSGATPTNMIKVAVRADDNVLLVPPSIQRPPAVVLDTGRLNILADRRQAGCRVLGCVAPAAASVQEDQQGGVHLDIYVRYLMPLVLLNDDESGVVEASAGEAADAGVFLPRGRARVRARALWDLAHCRGCWW